MRFESRLEQLERKLGDMDWRQYAQVHGLTEADVLAEVERQIAMRDFSAETLALAEQHGLSLDDLVRLAEECVAPWRNTG